MKSLFARRIEALLTAQTAEEKAEPARSLRRLVDVVLTDLRPSPLRWERDESDPDVQTATDRVLNKVWQVEDLDELQVVRVFGANQNLVMKVKMPGDADPMTQIESTREAVYAGTATLDQAWDAVRVKRDDRSPHADEDDLSRPLLLRDPVLRPSVPEPLAQ